MSHKSEVFYAKIMLFGEYSVICDSMGLAIPYVHFKGELSFIGKDRYTDLEFAKSSNSQLKDYLEYLKNLNSGKELHPEIDIEAFEYDLENGLYFESTIPQGFGIGSSGALCAAIYDRYGKNKIPTDRNINKKDIVKLRSLFSTMESYFHGVSSGIDPLNCYLRFPVLIKGKNELDTVGIPRNKHNKDGAIFLINTGSPGKTGPLVNLFFEKCKQYSFYKAIKEDMIPYNDQCIKSLIKGETHEFFKNLKSLSKFLLKNLRPMIPDAFVDIWKQGLESRAYYLKLCGSGGGGFLLGFTEDLELARKELKKHNVDLITVYENSK
ncbi:MAG: mevalonate kinase [Bacteroidetes bacterium]|nr:mevalonate kinase [Bacteroidota bacterium]